MKIAQIEQTGEKEAPASSCCCRRNACSRGDPALFLGRSQTHAAVRHRRPDKGDHRQTGEQTWPPPNLRFHPIREQVRPVMLSSASSLIYRYQNLQWSRTPAGVEGLSWTGQRLEPPVHPAIHRCRGQWHCLRHRNHGKPQVQPPIRLRCCSGSHRRC